MGYVLSFLAVCISLAFWFLRPFGQRATGLSGVFWGSMAVYLGTFIFSTVPFRDGLETLVRDFFFIAAFGAFLGIASGYKRLVLPGVLLSGFSLLLYTRFMVLPLAAHNPEIPLDPNGELLIELQEGARISDIQPLLERYSLEVERAFYPLDSTSTALDNYFVANIPEDRLEERGQILRQLSRQTKVVWVEQNEQIHVAPIPAAPAKLGSETAKYGLNDPGISELWAFEQLEMDVLYSILEAKKVQPRKKALIAILDTGVDAGHEDIRGNYQSLKSTYDNDPKGHGTHCAGIAAAVSNNATGIASFSRDNSFVTVTSVKVLGAGGYGTQKTIIEGILYAADQGASVLSLSLGGPSNQARQTAYEKAIQYARNKGAVVVVAAGNANRNARDFSPANVPGVLCVSAVDQTLNRAEFSNDVEDIKMAVAAPGVDIYSTIPGGQYTRYSGTSMATPYVAGLVGLLKSIQPGLKTEEVYQLLQEAGKETKQTARTGKFIQPARAVRRILAR